MSDRAAELADPVADVPQPGASVRGGRVEAGAGVAHGKFDVPVLAGHGHGEPAGVTVPDGVGARLLGDPQEGVLDRLGDGDVVQFGVDGDAETVVVGGADLPQGRDEPGAVQAGRAQLEQEEPACPAAPPR